MVIDESIKVNENYNIVYCLTKQYLWSSCKLTFSLKQDNDEKN